MATRREYLDDQTKRILQNMDLDDTTPLTLKDLPYIRMAMVNVSSHWYNIGIHFHIPTGTMDKFRSKNRNDPDNCLTCVIVEWLKNWNKRHGPPTWRKVVIAVSSRVGGDHPAEASRIGRDYKSYGSANSFRDSDKVDGRPLTSESTLDIIKYLLNGVATNWASIGLFFGIPYKFIERFKLDDTLEESVTEMVDAWLKRKHDVEAFGEPSWRKLVEAVASRSGGCNQRLAAEIASEHPLCYTVEPEMEEQPSTPASIPGTSTSSVMATPTTALHPGVLTEGSLATLMNCLRPVAYKWMVVCLQLGVSQGDLKNIESNPMRISGAPMTFLQDGLYTWLQQDPARRTISVLCDALRSPTVDEEILANEVEAKLKSH